MKLSTNRGPEGFTLLEIIVAMFLLALVVAAVYSSWMAIAKGSQIGQKVAADVQRSRIAIRTLEDALTSARMFAGDPQYYSFEADNGNKASLSFVSHLSKAFPRSGKFGDFDVRRVTFSLESDMEGGELVLRQNPMLMDLDIDEQEHPIVLAKDVKQFAMEFWDVRSGDWVDEWTLTNQLPPLVKLTLQFGDERQSRPRQEVTRVVAIPSVTVAANWQTPAGRPGGPIGGPPPPIRPGQPVNPGGQP